MPNATSKTNGDLLGTMNNFLSGIRATKEAALKKQAGGTGDGSDPSTHPVMKADNSTIPVTEGARGRENTSDIKKDIGPAGNTGQEDSAKGDVTNPVDSIGTIKQGPDEVKGNVQTPKKPDTLVLGNKHASYANVHQKAASILETITKLKPAGTVKAAAVVEPVAAPSTEEMQKTAAAKYPEDAENGYIAASILAQQLGLVKSAVAEEADVDANSRLQAIIKKAEVDANNACDYIEGLQAGIKDANIKRASLSKGAEGMIPPEAMAGDMPPEAGGGGPEGGAGGPPPHEGGGGELDALSEILAQHGITLEELVAALQGSGDAGGEAAGGEAPPPGAGAPQAEGGMETEKAATLKKTAAFIKNKAGIRSFLSKIVN